MRRFACNNFCTVTKHAVARIRQGADLCRLLTVRALKSLEVRCFSRFNISSCPQVVYTYSPHGATDQSVERLQYKNTEPLAVDYNSHSLTRKLLHKVGPRNLQYSNHKCVFRRGVAHALNKRGRSNCGSFRVFCEVWYSACCYDLFRRGWHPLWLLLQSRLGILIVAVSVQHKGLYMISDASATTGRPRSQPRNQTS